MRRFLLAILGILVVLVVIYLMGPRPTYEANPPDVGFLYTPEAGANSGQKFAEALRSYEQSLVASGELRPQAKARVIFADSAFAKTKYAMLYVHGFSASPPEGSPLVDEIAKRYGINLYFMRLSDHGLTSEESFADANPALWREEVERAINLSTDILGDSILIVGTSTGASLALDYMSRFGESPVAGLVLYSPNIRLANGAAAILNGPWGETLAEKLNGGKYRELTDIPRECSWIWTMKYRVEGVVALQQMLEETMTASTFSKVRLPVMSAWYYKDEDHKDYIVSTNAIEEMMAELGTPAYNKRSHPLAEVSGHVITTDCRTTGLERVRSVTQEFLEEVIGLQANLEPASQVD